MTKWVRTHWNMCLSSSSKQCVFLETGVWKQQNRLLNPGLFWHPQVMVCLSLCLLPWAMEERTFYNTPAMLQLIHGSWTLHDTSEQSLQLFLGEHVQKFSNCVSTCNSLDHDSLRIDARYFSFFLKVWNESATAVNEAHADLKTSLVGVANGRQSGKLSSGSHVQFFPRSLAFSFAVVLSYFF